MKEGVNSKKGFMIVFRTVGYRLVDKNLVLEKLRGVLDPEIGRSIVDLKMVRDISASDGNVYVKIALTVAHCPLAKTLQADVEKAVRELEDVRSVKVETTTMSRKELEELKQQLQPGAVSSTPSKGGPGLGPGIERLGKRGVRSIIAVISGKGGVGKSFVTSMLASELKRSGYEVGVLDADLTGPSIAKVLGVFGKPYKGPGGGIVPLRTKTGIKVMSINLVLEDPSMPVVWRGPIVNSVIRQLYWDVDWGDLHYLLVDLPPGTSDAPLTVFQSLPLDGVIVVSSPQDLASMIVSKAVNMAKKMDVPILGLVENMSYLKCPSCGKTMNVFGEPKGENLASSLGVPFLGAIPLDPAIAKLSDEGKIEEYSNSIIGGIVSELRTRAARQVEQLTQGLPIAWSIEP
ncbi:Mrp/NBP35 family ATP-binding protein [Candidatus Bathyarchaeota archaeon]|nr:MAG: Mrp/NBP35 family ATP-binding protein [Candidatus Bathyarchaeota archaeon]TMI45471.1 MAG: Mrp/NBP35 family ATP-binding protein [Candidatus Bathyarchaeota archaeon]